MRCASSRLAPRLSALVALCAVLSGGVLSGGVLAGCGARTTLPGGNNADTGTPSSFDAGSVDARRHDGGIDAVSVACMSDADCPDDGLVCNGSAWCNARTHLCEVTLRPGCDDGVACTVDRCDERGGGCLFEPDPSRCAPGSVCDPSFGCVGMCVPSAPTEVRCRDGVDDDCDGALDCADSDCTGSPLCTSTCTPTGRNELGVAACTNGLDDDCDGRFDCNDPDCSPFGPMGECCDGRDNNGDGNVDEFTCRCFDDDACFGVGSLDQTCWQDSYSVCAPRCNLYGGDRFCIDGFGLTRCNRMTGECL